MKTAHAYVEDVIDAPDLLKPAARSGRIAWDERGHGIWEWQTRPGVYSRDVNIQDLNVLANTDLSIVETTERVTRNFDGLWIHDDK